MTPLIVELIFINTLECYIINFAQVIYNLESSTIRHYLGIINIIKIPTLV